MALPVACVDAGVLDGIAAMEHHPVSHIDTHMGGAGGVVCALEEDQVAGARLRSGNPRTDTQQAGCAQPPEVPAHAAVVAHIADEAGTVEGRGGRGTAPDIGEVQVFLRFRQHGGEGLIVQCFGRHLILLRPVRDVFPDIAGGRKQVRAVAQGGHVQRVHGELGAGHGIDRDVREIEVFQLHGADVVGVRHLDLVLVFLRHGLSGIGVGIPP